MATVNIDIPGIGLVEARNAASESTLIELKKVMSKLAVKLEADLTDLQDGADEAGESLDGLSDKVKNTEEKFDDFTRSINNAIYTVNGLINSGTGLISNMANVGNSVTNAAQSLDAIPVVGSALATVFGAVAAAAEQVVDSFVKATGSGATFAGSILELARNAGMAGMTMDQFGELIRANGDGLLGLASNTAIGARRFSLLSRQILRTGDDLYALGFSTQDLNEGLVRYAAQQRFLGRQEQMTDQQLIAGTRQYVKDLDVLAKITGEERKAKEAERDALMKDAQFRLGLAGKSQDVVRSFGNLIQAVPAGPMQDFLKDVVTTGAVTSETNATIASQMGNSFRMLQEFQRMREQNIAISDAQMQRFLNTFGSEGRAAIEILGRSGQAANIELREAFGAIGDAAMIPLDAFKSAKDSQDLAIQATDDFNTRLQKAQQQLAQFGNFFQVALAQSGMLPFLLDSFAVLANIATEFLLPAFRAVGSFLGQTFVPILNHTIPLIDAFATVLGGVTREGLKGLQVALQEGLLPVVLGTAAGFATYKGLLLAQIAYQKISNGLDMLRNSLAATQIGSMLGLTASATGATIALSPLAAIGLAIGAAVAGVAYLMYELYDAGYDFKDSMMGFVDWFNNLVGSLSDEEYERRQAARESAKETRAQERANRSMFNNLIPNYQDLINLQQQDIGQKQQLLNLNDPVSLLKGFAEQEGSAFVTGSSSTGSPASPTVQTPPPPQNDTNTPAQADSESSFTGGRSRKARRDAQRKSSSTPAPNNTAPETVDEFSDLDLSQNTTGEKLDQLNTLVGELVSHMRETSRNTKSTADRLGNASGDLFSGIGA